MGNFTIFHLVISVWITFSFALPSLSFDYQDFDSWNANSPLCGNGKHQSPIDLAPPFKIKKGLPLVFINYAAKSSTSNITAFNDGHTIKITGNWGKRIPKVTGTLVNNAEYLLSEVHAHWSQKVNSGTEHSIDGKKYACELHLVHYNSKYANVIHAESKSDGLLVIGLLFQVNKKIPNRGLQVLSDLASTVIDVNSISIGSLDLGFFGLESIKSFYSYAGSLTTPPCTENIRWIVPNEILSTNADTMKAIRSIKLNNNDKSNVRPIQHRNRREIVLYKM